jgi:hypothetical protein
LFTSDPKIVKYKVYWNSKQDSIETAVTRTNGVDTAKLFIPNLPEGVMTFEIRTYDNEGHISIPVTLAGNVYGSQYQASLSNRGIAKAELQGDGSALINWADVNADDGLLSMQIKYTDVNNKLHDTLIVSQVPAKAHRCQNIRQVHPSVTAQLLNLTKPLSIFFIPITRTIA